MDTSATVRRGTFPVIFQKKIKCTCPSCGCECWQSSGSTTEVLCMDKISQKLFKILVVK